MATRCLGATGGGYLTSLVAPCAASAGSAPMPANMAACCGNISATIGMKNGTGAASGCLCEAETAAATIFILNSAGNAPQGKPLSIGIPLTGTNGILAQCVAAGYSDIYWPAMDTSYSNDCSNVDEYSMDVTSDYNYIPSYNGSEGMVIPTKLQNSARIPYVMTVTSTSAIIRWRTTSLSKSSACYATNISSAAAATASQTCVSATDAVYGSKTGTDHQVAFSGLTAGTKYYYLVGSNTSLAYSNGTYFKTAPASGASATATTVRFWCACSAAAAAVTPL